MNFEKTTLVVLTSLVLFTACGESVEPASSECPARAESELEDCVIEAGIDSGSSWIINSQEHLGQICASTCTRFDRPIKIMHLEGVTDLKAFESVRSAPAIEILLTRDLENLNGLQNVVWTGERNVVGIEENASLRTLEGLNAPENDVTLRISSNPELSNLRGLENVVTLRSDGQSDIQDNNSLQSLEGLNNLVDSGMTFNVLDNPGLTSLEGLDSLTTANYFNVFGNPSLRELDGALPSVETVFQIGLKNNTALPQCEIDSFLERVQPEQTALEGNGPPCDGG